MRQPYVVTMNDGTRIQVYATSVADAHTKIFPFDTAEIRSVHLGRI